MTIRARDIVLMMPPDRAERFRVNVVALQRHWELGSMVEAVERAVADAAAAIVPVDDALVEAIEAGEIDPDLT